MIKKIKGKYVVLSETVILRGNHNVRWVFGRYRTKQEAEERLRQVEYFKHKKGKV